MGLELTTRIKNNIVERRERLYSNKVNSIPSPFVRFRNDFLGIEQKKEYVISSFTKGSKTQFTSFVFVFTPLFFAYEHRDQIRVKFFFYLWEETKEDFTTRFICHLIYKLSNGKIEVSPTEIMSTDNNKPVKQEVLDIMETEEFNSYMKFFEDCSIFSDSQNPTGIYMECRNYAENNGVTYTKPKKYKDEFGVERITQSFDYYEANDKEEYKIIIIDHLSLVSTEKGMTLKQAMDKVGEYCIILRDRYNFTPVIIQQQNTDQESLDAIKMQKLRPTVAGLADSKYSARNCNIFLGLFSPMKFELKNYKGYDITKLKDSIRFLEVILNRGGQAGGLIALYFNGKVCDYKELPNPDNKIELQKWYDYIEHKNAKSFLLKIRKLIKNK